MTPNLVGELLWDARRLAMAHAGCTLDVRVTETRERPRTVVAQSPPPGAPLPPDRVVRVDVSMPSWVRHLPGIFQDVDEEHADFLARFLAIQQHLALQIDEAIETVHRCFDPREAPEHFLPWLASWVAMRLQEDWPEPRRREAILRAVELYRLRGTAAGLKLSLRLFAGVDVEIDEHAWPWPGFVIGRHSAIGVDSTLAPQMWRTNCFVVRLAGPRDSWSRESLRTIHAVIEAEKPAHAHYALVFATVEERFETLPFLRIGVDGRIGVDARIAGRVDEPPVETREVA